MVVFRQGLTRRIYGAADAGLVISFATYPSRCPPQKALQKVTEGTVPFIIWETLYFRLELSYHCELEGVRVYVANEITRPASAAP